MLELSTRYLKLQGKDSRKTTVYLLNDKTTIIIFSKRFVCFSSSVARVKFDEVKNHSSQICARNV